jgi:putative RNA 2'-phosphotransferase
MLKECAQHGFFRAEACPVCGQPARFLMNDRELDHLGRVLTGILRHFPDRYGLEMDPHGWIPLPAIVRAISQKHPAYHWLRPVHLVAIVETDAKGRYEIRDDRVRATYGHTVEVDLDLPTDQIPDRLFFPVTPEEVPIVLEVGLKPSDRKRVHLSRTADDARAAGSMRSKEPVILAAIPARRATGGSSSCAPERRSSSSTASPPSTSPRRKRPPPRPLRTATRRRRRPPRRP